MTTFEILQKAKNLSRNARLTTVQKNNALKEMAKALLSARDKILAANRIDIENAKGKINDVMIDRLLRVWQRVLPTLQIYLTA